MGLLLLPTSASAVTVFLTTDQSVYEVGDTITFNATAFPSFGFLGGGVTRLDLDAGLPGASLQTVSNSTNAIFTAIANAAGDFTASLSGEGFTSSLQVIPPIVEERDITQRACIFGSCFTVVIGTETVVVDPGGISRVNTTTFGSASASYSVIAPAVAPVRLPASGLLLLAPVALLLARKKRT